MGGLFKAPKPVVVTASTTPQTSTVTPAAVAAAGQAARVENQERGRRGLAGTIATSERGVLDAMPRPPAAARKTLLGE